MAANISLRASGSARPPRDRPIPSTAALAAVLDEAMGGACWLNRHPVVGARITINYRHMVPLGFSGRVEAGIDRIERRKCFITSRLSDADGKIARSFDLQVREAGSGKKDTRGQEIDHGFAERTTFVVTPDGKVAAAVGGLNPVENVNKSLEIVQKLKGT